MGSYQKHESILRLSRRNLVSSNPLKEREARKSNPLPARKSNHFQAALSPTSLGEAEEGPSARSFSNIDEHSETPKKDVTDDPVLRQLRKQQIVKSNTRRLEAEEQQRPSRPSWPGLPAVGAAAAVGGGTPPSAPPRGNQPQWVLTGQYSPSTIAKTGVPARFPNTEQLEPRAVITHESAEGTFPSLSRSAAAQQQQQQAGCLESVPSVEAPVQKPVADQHSAPPVAAVTAEAGPAVPAGSLPQSLASRLQSREILTAPSVTAQGDAASQKVPGSQRRGARRGILDAIRDGAAPAAMMCCKLQGIGFTRR